MTVRTAGAPPLVTRALLALGVLGALVAVVALVVDATGRGFRTGGTTTVALVGAGLGLVLVIAGVLLSGRGRAPGLDLRVAGAAAAVIGVVAAAVLVLAVPRPVLLRGVAYQATDDSPDLVLRPPAGVADGDLLVAAVYRRGPGALTAPAGWTSVRTTALPGDGGTLTLLTHTATDDDGGAPVTFAGGAPGTTLGGISSFANAGGAAVSGETSGAGSAPSAPDVRGDGAAVPAVAVVATSGVVEVRDRGDTTVAWQARVDGAAKGTLALLTRPGDATGPLAVDTAPVPAGWAVQGVTLDAG